MICNSFEMIKIFKKGFRGLIKEPLISQNPCFLTADVFKGDS